MSIRNYNAFLREVRKKHGLSQKAAQAAYRKLGARLGRSPKGVDVRKHPRLTKEAVTPKRRGSKPALKKNRKPPTGGIRKPGQRLVTSVSEWRRIYAREAAGGVEVVRIVSSADYGRGRRGRR